MELIFYPQAASLLGVKVDTLRHAVSRGDLTRGPRKGHSQSLIKEQVMLFTGLNPRTGNKKRLSLESLSPEEKRLWEHYANSIAQPAERTARKEEIRAMVQQEVSQQEESLREAFGDFLLQMGLQFKESIRPRLKEITYQKREVPEGVPFSMMS